MAHDLLRGLPPVGQLLEHSSLSPALAQYGHVAVLEVVRSTLHHLRQQILAGEASSLATESILARVHDTLTQRYKPTLRPVINATGVLIHTNLGRAPLPESALRAIQETLDGYNTLEFDLEEGGRGSRRVHCSQLLAQLTHAESALVVNNCAAALLLTLTALAHDREVVVSRGQLVEIGGGFRIPDVMTQGGARLVEVGTTNKTRLADYERALTPHTAMLLKVHSSNFQQLGFVETTPLHEMVNLAHARQVLVVEDVGSGALLDTADYGLTPEPTVQASIQAGADLVLFSGDKLLGGPQAGIIVGRADLIHTLSKHPLMRALRADKLTLQALVATLEHYQRGDAHLHIPIWWMMGRKLDELEAVAQRWQAHLPHAQVTAGYSTVGGGSLPGSQLPTALLSLEVAHPNYFLRQLRGASVPIIARVAEERVLLDPRTVFPEQETRVLQTLKDLLN